jgi:hypothetical protein
MGLPYFEHRYNFKQKYNFVHSWIDIDIDIENENENENESSLANDLDHS